MTTTPRLMLLMSKACLGIALSVSAFALMGGFAEAGSPQREAAPIAGKGTGVLATSAGNYVFTPSTCGIYRQDGVDDIEIQGPGKAPDGEIFFFEFSSTGNAMSVELGIDRPFASSDRKIQAGRHVSQEFTINASDNVISVSDIALVDDQGKPVDSQASLSIDCNR